MNARSRRIALAERLIANYNGLNHPFTHAVFEDSHEKPTYPNKFIVTRVADRLVCFNVFTSSTMLFGPSGRINCHGLENVTTNLSDAIALAELV
jgi:hypothetical protein